MDILTNNDYVLLETYLAKIEGSIGSNMYRNFYMNIEGKVTDVCRDGQVSCAYFLTCLLLEVRLTDNVDINVDRVVLDLKSFGWEEYQCKKSDLPKPGSIIVWEGTVTEDKNFHKHIGFAIKGGAISHHDEYKSPQKHSLFYKGHKVEKLFWHPSLDG